ncbi:glycosyltransferase [Rurimicrobium arvi]|uniref:Glycosyltransferase 2-like domain-containing protein n=1 Tax=Rurimicrobium arvi TaxID=2049916 RepID=A0ABP8MQD2_9BACT
MTGHKLVSVIIPNYNHAKFLDQRITSVLNQDYPAKELIILDDCSTDESVQEIGKFRLRNEVSHIVVNPVNSGSVFAQWQKGIELASGTYIWIAESDDYSDLSFLSTMVGLLEKREDTILAYSNSVRVDENGREFEQLAAPDFTTAFGPDGFADAQAFCKSRLLRSNVIPNASAVVFKKAFFHKKLLETARRFRLAGDWVFWTQLLHQPGTVAYSPLPLNKYRFHSGTVRFSKGRERRKDHLLENIRAVVINQEHIGLSEKEKQALKYGVIEKMISNWKQEQIGLDVKFLFTALSEIKKITGDVYIAFIRTIAATLKSG